MNTPREIYEQYRIMPNLQLHQLRVAAVGKYICERFKGAINESAVVTACLMHDMGNILKSDFSIGKELLAEKGIPYWKSVKADYAAKYADEHEATSAIIAEIGIHNDAAELIREMGLSKIETIVEHGSNELLVLEYADMRVGPDGVLLLDERLAEARARYTARMKAISSDFSTTDRYEILVHACHELEVKLIQRANFRPENITDNAIAPTLESLWNYQI